MVLAHQVVPHAGSLVRWRGVGGVPCSCDRGEPSPFQDPDWFTEGQIGDGSYWTMGQLAVLISLIPVSHLAVVRIYYFWEVGT